MTNTTMRKKMMGVVAAAALSFSMVMPAFAASEGAVVPTPNGTDVYAGIVVDDEKYTDAKIKVTVPTIFAFVVNGTKDTAKAADVLSSTNGSILLPNMKVKVLDHTVNNGPWKYESTGDGSMVFENYSTKINDANASKREGIEVELAGSFQNVGTMASRNYWNHVATPAKIKEFNLSVDGIKFDQDLGNNTLGMASGVTLTAPAATEVADVDATTKLAKVATPHVADFDVAVGGTRGDYNQVEESVKVGSIEWTVSYTIENAAGGGAETSPSNPPLQP